MRHLKFSKKYSLFLTFAIQKKTKHSKTLIIKQISILLKIIHKILKYNIL
jgi:hypothetical protein